MQQQQIPLLRRGLPVDHIVVFYAKEDEAEILVDPMQRCTALAPSTGRRCLNDVFYRRERPVLSRALFINGPLGRRIAQLVCPVHVR